MQHTAHSRLLQNSVFTARKIMLQILAGITLQVLLLSIPAQAGSTVGSPMQGDFLQTDLDGGGWVTGFAAHPLGRIYARTDVGGVYRSDDQGKTWVWLSGDMVHYASHLVQGIAVGDNSPDVVFKTTGASYAPIDPGRGVWRSLDGGLTWEHVLPSVNFSANDNYRWQGECIAITPYSNDEEILTITRGQGLWRSTTGGGAGSWFKEGGNLFDGLIGIFVHMHPAFPEEYYVGGIKGSAPSALYKGVRDKSGYIEWTPVEISAQTTAVTRLARLPSGEIFAAVEEGSQTGFYKSDPNGEKWTNITNTILGNLRPNGPLGTCQVLNDGKTILLGWLAKPTLKSTDGGATWTQVPMVITGQRPIAMLTTEREVYWARAYVQQDPLNPNRWYLPGGFGAFVSNDAGATVSYMTNGFGEVVTFKPVWNPKDPNIVYMPVADLICFISTDGGVSSSGLRNPRRQLPVKDGNVGMTYATKVLLGPTKGDKPPKAYFIGGSFFGPNNGRGSILTTNDDGQTWSLVHVSGVTGSGLPPYCDIVSGVVAPDDENEIIVAVKAQSNSDDGFYRSTDGGVTFTKCSGVPEGGSWGGQFTFFVFLEADSQNPKKRYAWVNGVGFLVSDDRGVTWRSEGHSKRGPAENKLYDSNKWAVFVRDPGTGYLWVGYRVAPLGLAYSTNNGVDWTYLDTPFSGSGFAEVRALDALNGQIVVWGRRFGDPFRKIYYSSDNGATFRECTKQGYRFPRVTFLALNPHHRGQFWVATNGRSYARYIPR